MVFICQVYANYMVTIWLLYASAFKKKANLGCFFSLSPVFSCQFVPKISEKTPLKKKYNKNIHKMEIMTGLKDDNESVLSIVI